MAGNITFNDFLDGDGIKRGIREIESLIKSLQGTVEDFQKGTQAAIEQSMRLMNERKQEVNALKKSLEGLNTTTVKGRKDVASYAEQLEQQAQSYLQAKKASDDYKASQDAAAAAVVDYKKKADELKEKFKALQDSQDPEKTKALQLELAKLQKELSKIKKAAKEGADGFGGFNDEQKIASDSIKGIKLRIKELKKEFEGLSQSQDPKRAAQLTFQLQQLNAEQKRLQDSIKGTNKSLGGINEAINFSANSYGDLRKKIKMLKEQLQDAEIGSREFVRVEAALNDALEREIELRERQPSLLAKRIRQAAGESKEVKALSMRLRELRKDLARTEDVKIFDKLQAEIKQTEQELNNLVSSQKQPAQGGFLGGFGGAALAGGIGGLAATLAPQALELAKKGLQDAVKAAIELDKKFTGLRDSIGRFSELTGDALGQTAANVAALGKKFEKEDKEIIAATRQLAKQTGISFNEAFGLIEKGFLQGADAQGEFLDKIREYPVQLQKAGFSAEEFIKISSQEIKAGIFSDKLLDSLKEAQLRLSEGTKATSDALKSAFGEEFTNTILKGVRTGELSVKDAVIKIGREADKIGLNFQKQQEIVANVFGAAGEDAGGFEAIIKNVNEALASNVDELDAVGQKQQENLNLQKEYEASQERLSRNFSGIAQAAENAFLRIQTASTNVLNSFLNIGSGFGKMIDFILGKTDEIEREAKRKGFIEKTLGQNPQKIVDDYKNLGTQISVLEAKIKRFQTGTQFESEGVFDIETGKENLKELKINQANLEEAYKRSLAKIEGLRKQDSDNNELFVKKATALAKRFETDVQGVISLATTIGRNQYITQIEALKQVETQIMSADDAFKDLSTDIENTGDATEKAAKQIDEFAQKLQQNYIDVIAEAVKGTGEGFTFEIPVTPKLVIDDDGADDEDINKEIQEEIDRKFKPIEIESILKAPERAAIDDATQRAIAQQEEQLRLDKERLKLLEKLGGKETEIAQLKAGIIEQQRNLNQLQAQSVSESFAFQAGENLVQGILQKQNETLQARQDARRAAINEIEDEAVRTRLLAREEKRAARERLAAQLKELVIQTTIGALKEGDSLGQAIAKGGKAGALSFIGALPAFKEGVINFDGVGTATSDSNLVRISRGESVITAKGTDKAPKLLEMINAGAVSDGDYIEKNIEKHTKVSKTDKVVFNIDYKRLAKEISDATYTQDLTRVAGEVILTNQNALNREKIIIETRKTGGKKWQ